MFFEFDEIHLMENILKFLIKVIKIEIKKYDIVNEIIIFMMNINILIIDEVIKILVLSNDREKLIQWVNL